MIIPLENPPARFLYVAADAQDKILAAVVDTPAAMLELTRIVWEKKLNVAYYARVKALKSYVPDRVLGCEVKGAPQYV